MREAELSRIVSHALRHEPWVYELELDAEGWTDIDQLLASIGGIEPAGAVARADLESMVANAAKQRHEIRGDRIRARYGHSVLSVSATLPASPPALLFHGTARSTVASILRDGLLPMHRKYVHLSADRDMASAVGRRKDPDPVILEVRAAQAHDQGASFYRGNEVVWLADHVSPTFIDVPVASVDPEADGLTPDA